MLKKLRNFFGVLGVLSAVSTFFGLRGFLRWMRQRSEYQAEYYAPAAGSVPRTESMQSMEPRRAPVYTGMTGFQPIPATGPEDNAGFAASSGVVSPEHEDASRRSDEPDYRRDTGPVDSSTKGPTGATPEVVPVKIPDTGAGAAGAGAPPPTMETMAVAMGVDPDAINTPATSPTHAGEPGTPEAAATPSTETVAGIHAGPLDLPLVEALLAHEDLMAVLRERRAGAFRDPEKSPNSLTPVDRMRFQHAVDRLRDALDQVNVQSFSEGGKEKRVYRIIEKVHNALSQLQYSDEDLMRIDTEVRAEACEALWSIQHVVDWDKAYTLYGCGR